MYAVDTMDQALELFTGLPAGERGEDGAFPEGSVNYLAEQQLEAMRQAVKDLNKARTSKNPRPPETKFRGLFFAHLARELCLMARIEGTSTATNEPRNRPRYGRR